MTHSISRRQIGRRIPMTLALMPGLLCLGCGGPASLTVQMPLHLEEHVDAATVTGSELPVNPPQPVEWRFDQPQQDWKPTPLWTPPFGAPTLARTGEGLRVTLTDRTRVPHARVPGTREVTVELVQNGRPVAMQRVRADGGLHDVTFNLRVEPSAWLALRILGSAHTNPIFVLVAAHPIRTSRRSVEWCVKAVDQRWSQKAPRIRGGERDAAQRAYEHARLRYRQVLSETDVE